MKNMATRKPLNEVELVQMRRRNEARLAQKKEELGTDYLLHPENKGVNWGTRAKA